MKLWYLPGDRVKKSKADRGVFALVGTIAIIELIVISQLLAGTASPVASAYAIAVTGIAGALVYSIVSVQTGEWEI